MQIWNIQEKTGHWCLVFQSSQIIFGVSAQFDTFITNWVFVHSKELGKYIEYPVYAKKNHLALQMQQLWKALPLGASYCKFYLQLYMF